ncbi:MAG: LysR family transcriptional regulator [Pseudomonadales bacterium]
MRAQIDLKRLRYIVEVARAESITTAAETLGLTQPALTRSIGEVEALLGTRLFHRLPRGMQLTEVGTRFVERAWQILGEVEDLIADVSHTRDRITGRLRLGVAPAAWLPYARPALTRLASEYPGIKIEVVNGTVQELCPRLLHGELTCLLSTSSYLKRWRDLEIIGLKKLANGCLVRRDHPVTQMRKPLEADILGYPVVLPTSVDPTYSDIAQRYVHHNLPPPQPHYVTDDWELIKDLVRCSDAFHPVIYQEDAPIDEDGLEVLHGVIRMSDHRVSIAFSRLSPKSEAAELFERMMRETVI